MSGIVFPNVTNTLAPLMHMTQGAEQSKWLNEDREAKKSVAPFIQGALSGDPTALNEIASRHPDTAMKIAPLLERLDAGKRAKVKEDADFITQTGVAILNAPPAQQPQLYAQVRAEAQAKGRDVSNWPTQYDPGWVKFNVDKAMPFAEHFKRSGEGVTFAPPAAGDGQPPGGGVNPNNIGNVRPVGGGPSAGFQQPATFDDGVRLAVNNAKAYPQAFNGGQPMTLMQIGAKWAPKGDGANDPTQWARNVASVSGLDPNRPLDLNDPQTAAAFARGVHGAEHGANKVQPPEVYARILAGGGPPGLPQGGDPPPRGDGSGNPIQPAQAQPQALQPLRGLQIPPGARVALQGGVPIVKDGNVLYLDANGRWGAAPLPKAAAPKEAGAGMGGPFAGNGMDSQARNALVRGANDPAFAETPEYAAAFNHLGRPHFDAGTGTTIPAEDMSRWRQPTYSAQGQQGGAQQGASPGIAPAPQGVPVAPAAPGGITATPVQGLPTKEKPMTEAQARAYGFSQRMETANTLLNDLAIQGTSSKGRFLEALPGGLGNYAQSSEYQRFEQAKRNFMNSQLRDESGAVIGTSEFMSADKQYFPQPGQATNKELIAQMAENRRQVVEAMMVKAGILKRGERYEPPKAAAPAGDGGPPANSADKGRLIFDAQQAIREGRDPAGVRAKLKQLGVDPAELDKAE